MGCALFRFPVHFTPSSCLFHNGSPPLVVFPFQNIVQYCQISPQVPTVNSQNLSSQLSFLLSPSGETFFGKLLVYNQVASVLKMHKVDTIFYIRM